MAVGGSQGFREVPLGVEAKKIGGGLLGPWAAWRSGARIAAAVACVLIAASSAEGDAFRRTGQGGEAPRVAEAGRFSPPVAGLPLGLSPALAARVSAAGAPVAWEVLPEALRPAPPRPVVPPPGPTVGDIDALRGDLEGAAGRHMGRYGVVVFDPDSGSGVSLGGKEEFTAASVGKLPTLIALYRAAARGEIDLEEKIDLRYEDYQSYGTGVLHNYPLGTRISLRDCAYLLVNKSDNTAWRMLERRLGMANIQAEMAAIGATGTDYANGVTTPEDVFLMLRKIGDPSFTDEGLSREMLQAMTDTAFEDRIPAALPPDVRVAHKIGSYEDSYGDAGIVFYKDRSGSERRYFIVVLSGGTGEGSARAAMQEMSRAAYEALAAPRRGTL